MLIERPDFVHDMRSGNTAPGTQLAHRFFIRRKIPQPTSITGLSMKPNVLVVNANKTEADSISLLLESEEYTIRIVDNFEAVEQALKTSDYIAVILDLDSFEVSNRAVRQLTLMFPEVCFLCTSWKPFHPELQDAICYHIYACIQKPIDPDELLYWLKSIQYNQITDSKDSQAP
jgi:DNA-binding NtrC family response regulator